MVGGDRCKVWHAKFGMRSLPCVPRSDSSNTDAYKPEIPIAPGAGGERKIEEEVEEDQLEVRPAHNTKKTRFKLAPADVHPFGWSECWSECRDRCTYKRCTYKRCTYKR